MGGSTEFAGTVNGKGLRIAVVASRFNRNITNRLVQGAEMALTGMGIPEGNKAVFWVPGAFELPLAAKKIVLQKEWDALVCVAVVIKGETAHFNYISTEVARGLADVMRETGIPIGFGVLTTYNTQQALDRSENNTTNKGYEAAASAIEMVNFLKQLEN